MERGPQGPPGGGRLGALEPVGREDAIHCLDRAAAGDPLLGAGHLAEGQLIAAGMRGGPGAVGGGERLHGLIAGDADHRVAKDLAELSSDGDGEIVEPDFLRW